MNDSAAAVAFCQLATQVTRCKSMTQLEQMKWNAIVGNTVSILVVAAALIVVVLAVVTLALATLIAIP